jgi:glycosidase
MLDAVFNHIGDTSPQWLDVMENGEKSKYADWFHINKFPVSYTPSKDFEFAADATYDTFAFTPHMPKLNTANPEVQEYLLHIAKYWIEEFDIDAWRLDVADEVDHHFWKRFKQTCAETKDDFYILGEIWHSSQNWLNGDEFDAVMNYAFTDAIIQYFVKDEIPMDKMVSELNSQMMLYREQVNQVQFNVLDSHDTARILSLAKEDKELVKQVMTFTYLQKGVPCLYYGDEYAMTGMEDPDCRKPMAWEKENQDQDMFDFVKELIALRHDYQEILTNGNISWDIVDEKSGLITFTREYNDEFLTCTFNSGEDEVITLCENVIFNNQATINDDEAILEPRGFIIEHFG